MGLEIAPSGQNLELKPYAISDVTTDRGADPPTSNVLDGDFGLDAKYGVTQGLTADFTYNTDFAQVEVDEQQVNLTRFSLFFPEKREFFLEGQGIFEFGGGERRDPAQFLTGGSFGNDTPVVFFSRRIGLQDGEPAPIILGARLSGRAGRFTIGALNIETDDEPVSGAVRTNFTVARLKADVLRRSAIGAIFTRRSVSTEAAGSNVAYGVDGSFAFFDNLNIDAYVARTETQGLRRDDLSYRARLDYNGDRYGVVAERLSVGSNFNPEVGFVRRDDIRRNFASARFSPRPRSLESIRKLSFDGSFDYINDGAGRLETRLAQVQFGIEYESGDRFLAVVTDNYEFLDEPFEITNEVTIPVGEYSFRNARIVYALGQQRRLSGALAVEHGGFFDGEKTSLSYIRGRVGLTSQFSVEPTVSVNWVDLPEGRFTSTLVTARATYTVTPRMFVSALLQYNSSGAIFGTNARLRWEYLPGSELFVVYTDERDTALGGRPVLESRGFVVKINRLFRF